MIDIQSFSLSANLSGSLGATLALDSKLNPTQPRFTTDETKIIRLLSEGKSREQVAAKMKWSVSKLRYVLIGARAVARVRNDTELVAFATRRGLI